MKNPRETTPLPSPAQAVDVLKSYNTCVFGLREIVRLALKNNLVDKEIAGAMQHNLDSVDKFFKG